MGLLELVLPRILKLLIKRPVLSQLSLQVFVDLGLSQQKSLSILIASLDICPPLDPRLALVNDFLVELSALLFTALQKLSRLSMAFYLG